MKKIFLGVLFSVVVLSLLLPQIINASAVLQVNAEPGVSIWLNNELAGKTSREENGLLIADLVPGEYILKASKPGYDATETLLTVEDNQTIEWRIKFTKSVMKVEDAVKRVDSSMIEAKPTGIAVLRSIPLNAEIFFDGESIGNADKKLTYVPAAEHTVKFVFQKRELAVKFSLQPDESILLRADFAKGEIVKESGQREKKLGPALIRMQTARNKKPALFPHRKHQGMYDCVNCHHGMDSEGNQTPYVEGMTIQHCVTCHNPKMENKQLSSLMQASHARCKGCHKKVVAESGTAGPIGRCSGCHIVPEGK